jgi:hypothetical protein
MIHNLRQRHGPEAFGPNRSPVGVDFVRDGHESLSTAASRLVLTLPLLLLRLSGVRTWNKRWNKTLKQKVEHKLKQKVEHNLEHNLEHKPEQKLEHEVKHKVEQKVKQKLEHEVKHKVEQKVKQKVEARAFRPEMPQPSLGL